MVRSWGLPGANGRNRQSPVLRHRDLSCGQAIKLAKVLFKQKIRSLIFNIFSPGRLPVPLLTHGFMVFIASPHLSFAKTLLTTKIASDQDTNRPAAVFLLLLSCIAQRLYFTLNSYSSIS